MAIFVQILILGLLPAVVLSSYTNQGYSSYSQYENPPDQQNDDSASYQSNSQPYVAADYDDLNLAPAENAIGDIQGQEVPLTQVIQITRNVGIPIYRHVAVPYPQPVPVAVPQPVPVAVPRPYPVHVAVPHPVAVPVYRTHTVTVEKPVPYEVDRPVPYPVDRPYPVHIEKKVPVPYLKPYPVPVPVIKYIHHYGHDELHGHGWH